MCGERQERYTISGTVSGSAGFSILELALLFLVAGLLTGAVIVGCSVVANTRVRAQLHQLEQYQSAATTFAMMYPGAPGDLNSAAAATFGFAPRAGNLGRGDGNGVIEAGGALTTGQVYGQEAGLFWNDLSRAGLIPGKFYSSPNTDSEFPQGVTTTEVSRAFPLAAISRGNRLTVGSVGSVNYLVLAGIESVASGTGVYRVDPLIAPSALYQLDQKVDDGWPNHGRVRARGNRDSTNKLLTDLPEWATTASDGVCVTGGRDAQDEGAAYNTDGQSGGGTPACIARIELRLIN